MGGGLVLTDQVQSLLELIERRLLRLVVLVRGVVGRANERSRHGELGGCGVGDDLPQALLDRVHRIAEGSERRRERGRVLRQRVQSGSLRGQSGERGIRRLAGAFRGHLVAGG